MFRGSTTFLDWVQDFENAALPFPDQHLGAVHNGFRDGVLSVIGWINSLVGDSVVVVGHSLGAGHAALYAGYRVCDGLPVDKIVMFGEPRPGGSKLASILAATPIMSYCNFDRNGHDRVTDVPFNIPFVLTYQHPKPLTYVSASPKPNDHWGIFCWHHAILYAKAMGSVGPAVDILDAVYNR